MRRTFVFLVHLSLAGLISGSPACRRAAPTPAPAPAAAPVDKAVAVRALLAKGRQARTTDLAAASAAFAEARGLTPEDPELLAELGLTQLYQGELDQARETTRAALRAAETPAQTAAPAYNLGRIEQAAGRIDEAVTSFELALAAQPAPELQQHLATLKAVLEQGQPQPLAGPFASLPAVCDFIKTTQPAAPDSLASCGAAPCEFSCPLQELGHLTTGLPPLVSEVRVFWSRRRAPAPADAGPAPEQWSGEPRCGSVNAAVRLGAKWYAAPVLRSFCSGSGQKGEVKLTRLTVETVGPTRLAALYLDAAQEYPSGSAGSQSLTLFGVGPAKKPSRLGPILLGAQLTRQPPPAAAGSPKTRDLITYKWRLADGAVQVSGQTADSWLGEHKLTHKAQLALRYPLALP
jgi:hypothetical protein